MTDPRFSPINFAAELNPQQYQAVSAPQGPALVLAGAGTGKTRTLTYRVAWLLHQGAVPGQILLLTFTNKAAREMLERVEQLTGHPPQHFWGGTFHSIGQRILRRHGSVIGIEPNFTIMDKGDAESLLGTVIRESNPAFLKDKDNPKARVIAEVFSYTRNTRSNLEAVLQERYPWLLPVGDALFTFYSAYRATKLKQQICDYDDLLEHWLTLIEQHPDILEYFEDRFAHVLVDEYQDTNKLQGEIIFRLSRKNRNIMVVGDNWQCIYTWRGAEFANMEAFSREFPERVIYKVETNYRSCPEILNYANTMMDGHPAIDGYPLLLNADKPDGRLPAVVSCVDTVHQAQFVMAEIRRLLSGHELNLGDIAVLYRAHYHSMDLQMELSRTGVPFTITSGVRFFEQAHIRDLVAMLRFVHNPGDQPAFERMVVLLPRIGAQTARKLFAFLGKLAAREHKSPIALMASAEVCAKVPKHAADDWKDLAITLQDMEEAMGGPAPNALSGAEPDLFRETVDEQKRDALARPPAEILQLAIDSWYGDFLKNCYDNWTSRRDDLDGVIGFASRYDSIAELLAQLVLLNAETSNRSIDSEQDTLRLTTIHQAKGLEFPVVFVLGLADGLFPLKRAIESGDIDEERRLFYVGITRAKERLYLIYPRVSTQGGPPQPNNPSRFLQEIPDSYFELVQPRRF